MFDQDFIQNIAFSSTAIIPIIIALVQMFKMTGWVRDRYAPFISVLIGIILAFLMAESFTSHVGESIFTGIIYGLSASGLYSGLKSSSDAIKMDRMKKANEENQNKQNAQIKQNKGKC